MLEFGPSGQRRVRVRETYVRDFVAPSLTSSAVGQVKLDLVLRALADGSPAADPGVVPPEIRWEQLHDIARTGALANEETHLKRKWVTDQLGRLERANLVRRELRPGARSTLIVLRDDGSGLPFDDPGSASESYVSVLAEIFTKGLLGRWGSSEVAAYMAAMIAERYARSDPAMQDIQADRLFGDGVWFRSLDWFEDEAGLRPIDQIRVPFTTRTLRRGISQLRTNGLIASKRSLVDPRTGRPFKAEWGRIIYTNGFGSLRRGRAFHHAPRKTAH